jgi:hypothetical protein
LRVPCFAHNEGNPVTGAGLIIAGQLSVLISSAMNETGNDVYYVHAALFQILFLRYKKRCSITLPPLR